MKGIKKVAPSPHLIVYLIIKKKIGGGRETKFELGIDTQKQGREKVGSLQVHLSTFPPLLE
jgi:hypothetical protein